MSGNQVGHPIRPVRRERRRFGIDQHRLIGDDFAVTQHLPAGRQTAEELRRALVVLVHILRRADGGMILAVCD
jgi:hypothetical protein